MAAKWIRWQIRGMICENCPVRIEKALRRKKGVVSAEVSEAKACAEICYEPERISEEEMRAVIEELGYTVEKGGAGSALRAAGLLAGIVAGVLLLQFTGLLNILTPGRLAESGMSYGLLFVTGLLTSVHCIAMCGGINLTQSLPRPETVTKAPAGRPLRALFPAALYNLGRVCCYTAEGIVLGAVGWAAGGSFLGEGSTVLQGILKMAAGLVMAFMGLRMLGLIPASWRLTLPLSRILPKRLRPKQAGRMRPFWIGVCNGFLPCGPLQLMWVVALASGNPLRGGLSMFAFALGTVPLMLGLGSIVSLLGQRFTRPVLTAGSVLVVILGLSLFTQGGVLAGWLPAVGPRSGSAAVAQESEAEEEIQVIRSTLKTRGYPAIEVKAGIPVRWIIDAPEEAITSCNVRMQIPEYDLSVTFEPGENIIEFLPEKAGRFSYSCWMGMIYGSIQVTDP